MVYLRPCRARLRHLCPCSAVSLASAAQLRMRGSCKAADALHVCQVLPMPLDDSELADIVREVGPKLVRLELQAVRATLKFFNPFPRVVLGLQHCQQFVYPIAPGSWTNVAQRSCASPAAHAKRQPQEQLDTGVQRYACAEQSRTWLRCGSCSGAVTARCCSL